MFVLRVWLKKSARNLESDCKLIHCTFTYIDDSSSFTGRLLHQGNALVVGCDARRNVPCSTSVEYSLVSIKTREQI